MATNTMNTCIRYCLDVKDSELHVIDKFKSTLTKEKVEKFTDRLRTLQFSRFILLEQISDVMDLENIDILINSDILEIIMYFLYYDDGYDTAFDSIQMDFSFEFIRIINDDITKHITQFKDRTACHREKIIQLVKNNSELFRRQQHYESDNDTDFECSGY